MSRRPGEGHKSCLIQYVFQSKLATFLLDKGATINLQTTENKSTPLMLAILHGHDDIVQMLVERKVDVTLTKSDDYFGGRTPVASWTTLGPCCFVESQATA